jgi:hypothetical protein
MVSICSIIHRSVLEHIVSNQPQPQAHTERAQSEMRLAVLRALSTLPENESRAIHERLGLGSFSTTTQGADRGTGMLKFSQMDNSSGADAAKSLYQKGALHYCHHKNYNDTFFCMITLYISL